MKRIIIFISMLILAGQLPLFSQSRMDERRPVIQLALLLDTSNSMDGLINQAKSQLWKIVSETGRAKRGGRKPVLQVALYEYGNDNLPVLEGYIRQVVPFTTDLDYISHNLFGLSTCGGSEYCGQVISEASRHLDWDRNPDTLKIIFIAGNEPFTQGSSDYVRACTAALNKDIIVNTIFCGDYREGVATNWQHGARVGGGRYMNINSDYEISYIRAPQDERIEELNRRLNSTYLGYGAAGSAKKEMQAQQDSNASGLSRGSFLERAKVKSSSSYSNSSWDLVDAYAEGEISLPAVKADDLPEEMRKMTDKEKESYIKKMQDERKTIQAEISLLSAERDEYIKSQGQKQEEATLDSAMIDAIRDAAKSKGFDLE